MRAAAEFFDTNGYVRTDPPILTPNACEQRLRVVRPQLPGLVNWLELRRLRVGRASVDLRFERKPGGEVGVEMLKTEGNLQVEVERD